MTSIQKQYWIVRSFEQLQLLPGTTCWEVIHSEDKLLAALNQHYFPVYEATSKMYNRHHVGFQYLGGCIGPEKTYKHWQVKIDR